MAEIIDADFLVQRSAGVNSTHCVRKGDLTKEFVADAESISYANNSSVFIKETGRSYIFDPASTATPDHLRVLAPAGGGRLLMTAPVMTDAEVAAAIRIATTSQSGLASAAHITALQTGVVGAKAQIYTPSAVWTSTRTIAEITGSSITYTPKYTDSIVEYEFTFVATSTSAAGTLHIRHQIDSGSGFSDVSGNFCTLYRDYTNSEDQFTVKFAAASWGLTAATLRLAARDYSSSDVMVLHRVDSKDGAASNELQKAICKITEIR